MSMAVLKAPPLDLSQLVGRGEQPRMTKAWRSNCDNPWKSEYDTEYEARQAIERRARQRNRATRIAPPQGVYKCRCGAYHHTAVDSRKRT